MNTTRRTRLATRASRLTTVVGLALAALSLPAQAQDANPNVSSEGQWVPGRLLVQPRPGLSEAEFDKILQPHGAKSVGKIEGIGVHILQLPPQASEKAVEALLKSVVASPMIRYRGPFVIGGMPRDAWFNVAMMQKDLQLALDQGHASGVTLPTTALAQQWLSMARGLGLGARDFATVFDVLAGLSGLSASPNR